MAEDSAWKKYEARFKVYPSLVTTEPDPLVKIIFCIPVFAEPHILRTLESLLRTDPAGIKAEAILLFNLNESATVEDLNIHEKSWMDTSEWIRQNMREWIKFIPLYVPELPDPKGGVGWARKFCMDEAARRLGNNGILVCLDADCKVSPNYVIEIEKQFDQHEDQDAASIYFEHNLDELEENNKSAIIGYELHLRYLIHAQRWCGHPFAFYTVGSSMAVRREAYLRQGGMNTRRAGEDFYFLQKFIETGKIFEIQRTTVYPAARISKKVPFGTGRAMEQILLREKRQLTTNFEIYRNIRPLFTGLDILWSQLCVSHSAHLLDSIPGLNHDLKSYLEGRAFITECRNIFDHTSSYESFRKRFFRYFNAFQMIRYTHDMRDYGYQDIMPGDAVKSLFEEMNIDVDSASSEYLLHVLRCMDKGEFPIQ